jgi:hypothetical protein
MSVSALIRSATRARAAPFARPAQRALFVQQPVQRAAFSVSAGRFAGDVDAHDPHHEESFEEFTARYAVPVFAVFWEGRKMLEIAMAGREMEEWCKRGKSAYLLNGSTEFMHNCSKVTGSLRNKEAVEVWDDWKMIYDVN